MAEPTTSAPYDAGMEPGELSVAVVGPFPPIKGGISQHTAAVADALEQQGADVRRISWARQYPRRLYGRDQIDPDARPTPGAEWLLTWYNPLGWIRAGLAARSREVVILPWVSPFLALAQLVILLVARSSTRIVHVHNVMPHEPMPLQRFLARLVLGRADHLVCHATALQGELADLGVTTASSVTPMPPLIGVDATPLPSRPPVRLLFLGTIRPYKGLDIALAALALLPIEPALELRVVGELWDEDERPRSEAIAAARHRVSTSFGYASDESMVAELGRAHILVAPYRSATQSGVVALALAAGRPVVATAVGGLPEAIVDGVDGILADEPSPDAFASAISKAVAELDSLAAGAAARRPAWDSYVAVVTAIST
jgi:glycosyltransferase involved in cell wall biosynthesis